MSGLKRQTESNPSPNEESAEKDSEDVCEENKQTETDDNKQTETDDNKITNDSSETYIETKVATRTVGTQYDLVDASLDSCYESDEFPIEDDFMTNLIQEFKRLLSKRPLIEEIQSYVITKEAERAPLKHGSMGISLDNDQVFCIGVLDIVDTFPKDMREETIVQMLDWLLYIEQIYTMTSIDDDDDNEDTEQNLD